MNYRRNSRLLALTGLALLLFSPPLVVLFNRPAANGLSWLPLYLFVVWGAVIGMAAWLLQRPDAKPREEPRERPYEESWEERRRHEK
ncbi:hypothetical protein ACPF7Z_06265 [Halomonas sp. GXIMD04776]|uniref:hypothetical protein n=1 Tax=Halomonas sp. GXIMD04776 TaxID=3415605 RepID=UPI003C97DF9B